MAGLIGSSLRRDALVSSRGNEYQLKVYPQDSLSDPTEHFTCGYHSIKNGILLLQAIAGTGKAARVADRATYHGTVQDPVAGFRKVVMAHDGGITATAPLPDMAPTEQWFEPLTRFVADQYGIAGRMVYVPYSPRALGEMGFPLLETAFWRAVADFKRGGGDKVYAFMLRSASNSRGHWIAVIANRIGSSREYLIADSLNEDYVNWEGHCQAALTDLICYLESF